MHIKLQRGFTLIEILIVVAIIGIIMAIAMPNYQAYVLKSNRTEAISALSEIIQAQERFAASNGTYTTDLTALGYAATVTTENSNYTVTASICSGAVIAACVLLTATAATGQDTDQNGNGGDLTFNSRGQKVGWENG